MHAFHHPFTHKKGFLMCVRTDSFCSRSRKHSRCISPAGTDQTGSLPHLRFLPLPLSLRSAYPCSSPFWDLHSPQRFSLPWSSLLLFVFQSLIPLHCPAVFPATLSFHSGHCPETVLRPEPLHLLHTAAVSLRFCRCHFRQMSQRPRPSFR